MNKSPLSVAFGLVLQNRRLLLGVDADKIAIQLGNMSVTYYKAVEAGSYNLHVNNSYELCKAFENQNYSLSLPGVIHMLGVISILETVKKDVKDNFTEERYAKAYHAMFIEITRGLTDLRMKTIRERFEDFGIFELLKNPDSGDDIKNAIVEAGITNQIERLISIQYLNLLDSPRSDKYDGGFAVRFLNDFPSIYYGHLIDIKNSIQALPMHYDYRSSWKWENSYKNNIVGVFGISLEDSFLISRLAIRRYSYNYLAGQKFETAQFIFLNGSQTADKLAAEFRQELIKAIASYSCRVYSH